MSETKDATDKTLRGGARKPLTLNRTVESGHVQQKFGHGRSKSVEVVKKRKRTLAGSEVEEAVAPTPVAPPKALPPRATTGQTRPTAQPGAPQASAVQPQRVLSDREQAARASAAASEAGRRAQAADAEAERRLQLAQQEAGATTTEAVAALSTSQEATPQPVAATQAATADAEAVVPAGATAESEPVARAQPAAAAVAQDASAAAGEPTSAGPAASLPVARPVASPLKPGAAPVRPGQALPPKARPNTPSPQGRTMSDRSGRAGEPMRPIALARPVPRLEDSSAQLPYKPVGMTRPMIVSRTDRPSPKPPEPPKKVEEVVQAKKPPRPSAAVAEIADEEESRAKKRGGVGVKAPRSGPKADESRVRGKLTITNAFDESQRQRSLSSTVKPGSGYRFKSFEAAFQRCRLGRTGLYAD